MHDLEKLNRHSSHAEIVELAVSVIDCYAQIIQKSPYYPLQDILGILTTVFKYGQHAEAVAAGKRAFETLAIDCWLEAIPQLTAQLNHPSRELQPIIEKHMQRLARAHPQTMLSSLAAVAQYPSKERAAVANRLLNVMRLYDDTLVSEVS
jgi:phosphatidylinositol kinase/protein kinase (PI-3  family)